jgi:drug/metabolite transporter (DMT)-like permease
MIGVLAKTIPAPAAALVVGRCAVAAVALALVCRLTGRSLPATRSARLGAVVAGLLLGGHWLTLFVAYKIADVAPVVIAVFTFPVMVSLLEPWFFGARPGARQLAAAALVVVGVWALQGLAPAAAAEDLPGIGLALVSAALFSVRNVLSRRLLVHADALVLMGWQTGVAAIAVAPALFLGGGPPPLGPWALGGILVLGLFFTALPHTIGVWAMGRISAATVGIVGSQQVIYGIAFAWLLLGEPLHAGVAAGAALVLLAVAAESRAHWRRE